MARSVSMASYVQASDAAMGRERREEDGCGERKSTALKRYRREKIK